MATVTASNNVTLNSQSIRPVIGSDVAASATIGFKKFLKSLSRPNVSTLDFFNMSGIPVDRDNFAQKLYNVRESTSVAREVETGDFSQLIQVRQVGQKHRQAKATFVVWETQSSWIDHADEVKNAQLAESAAQSVYEGAMNYVMKVIGSGFDAGYDAESTAFRVLHPGLDWTGNTANAYTGGISVASANDRKGLNGAKILAAEALATDESVDLGTAKCFGNFADMTLPYATQFPMNASEFMTPVNMRPMGVAANVMFTLNSKTGSMACALPKITSSDTITNGALAKVPAFGYRNMLAAGRPDTLANTVTAGGTLDGTAQRVSNSYLVNPNNCVFYVPGTAEYMTMKVMRVGVNANTIVAYGAFGFANLAPQKTIVIPNANGLNQVAPTTGFPQNTYAFTDNDANPDG